MTTSDFGLWWSRACMGSGCVGMSCVIAPVEGVMPGLWRTLRADWCMGVNEIV